ncbi:hypothetical protein FTV88_0030 [Heliorestis convoluta]|uniref:Uncharacterized protein n=1 Tax=Heliorestis convoluta TaxID=356322 RepID=A0A5Q2MY12_9FIRM|nr:hypothetical protein FTV88_0030 [Heliorestis convoluta]
MGTYKESSVASGHPNFSWIVPILEAMEETLFEWGKQNLLLET